MLPMPNLSRRNYLHGNPKVKRRNAKLWRLKVAGLLPRLTKAQQRQLCAEAVKSHPITVLPPQPVPTSNQQHKPKLTRFKTYDAMK